MLSNTRGAPHDLAQSIAVVTVEVAVANRIIKPHLQLALLLLQFVYLFVALLFLLLLPLPEARRRAGVSHPLLVR
jgi:hypothetical protein